MMVDFGEAVWLGHLIECGETFAATTAGEKWVETAASIWLASAIRYYHPSGAARVLHRSMTPVKSQTPGCAAFQLDVLVDFE